ncbi:MAG: hypothetical protein ISR58_18910 [Anaerolineales bacterium]|nr:hypothetical protein [Chloroflexota bacterium]MBL6983253.1 hypothetical protein [Anaerolineales bacterium]
MSNIASVSWGDHLVFGEGDGRLHSPAALRRRMNHWRKELGASSLHWRIPHTKIPGQYHKAEDYPQTIERRSDIDWNFLRQVPELAYDHGMKAYLYVSIFDEGFPLDPPGVRAVSYHNAMHAQHITWQSDFSRRHPNFALVDRTGEIRQWGVLSLAYPQVREHYRRRFRVWLESGDWDGLFVCTRSQSRPAEFADQFGFNEPVRQDYLKRFGRDIRTEDFDLKLLCDLRGEYLTLFLSELREMTVDLDVRLTLGMPRGDVLGPPLGNLTLAWREWLNLGLVDELIINQNSSVCPSMWHDLWPMHRGYGYAQNYLDGYNLPPLLEHLSETYTSAISRNGKTELFVARQWDERSETEEQALLTHPVVSGLVYSTFRHDNPKAVKRGDWAA